MNVLYFIQIGEESGTTMKRTVVLYGISVDGRQCQQENEETATSLTARRCNIPSVLKS